MEMSKQKFLRGSGKTELKTYLECILSDMLNGLPPTVEFPMDTVHPKLVQELINHLKDLDQPKITGEG